MKQAKVGTTFVLHGHIIGSKKLPSGAIRVSLGRNLSCVGARTVGRHEMEGMFSYLDFCMDHEIFCR